MKAVPPSCLTQQARSDGERLSRLMPWASRYYCFVRKGAALSARLIGSPGRSSASTRTRARTYLRTDTDGRTDRQTDRQTETQTQTHICLHTGTAMQPCITTSGQGPECQPCSMAARSSHSGPLRYNSHLSVCCKGGVRCSLLVECPGAPRSALTFQMNKLDTITARLTHEAARCKKLSGCNRACRRNTATRSLTRVHRRPRLPSFGRG